LRVGPTGRRPGPRQAALLVLVCLGLCVTAGLALQRADLLRGIVGTEILCLLAPLAAALALGRYTVSGTLSLRWPGWRTMGLAVWIAPAAAILAGQIFWLQSLLMPPPDWYLEILDRLAERGRTENLALGVLGLCVLPALCEEGVFRGFVLSGLEGPLGPAKAVWLSALFFSLLHVDLYRFTAVFGLGALLGFLVVTSRSVYPAIAVHALNNLLVLAPPSWPERIGAPWLVGNERAPLLWMGVGVAVLAVGCGALRRVSTASSGSAGGDGWAVGEGRAH